MPGGAMMRTAALYAKSAAVALALLCALAVAEENHGFSSHVITDVNEMSFDEIVRPPKMLSFINFYSDNCSPCVELKQTVSKVADLYTEENHLQIIAINIDRNRGLAHRFDLKDMPALIMFETVDGEFKNERYEGGRSETDVIDYINKKGGFNATPTKKSHKTGLVPEVHEDLKGFASASANERAAMAAKARDTVQDLNDQDKMSLFEKYVTVMKSVQQHGVDWISEEFGRLKELLENHAASLTDDKQVEFAGRINVLSFFKEDL